MPLRGSSFILSAVFAAGVVGAVFLSPAIQAAGGTPPHNLTPPVVMGAPSVGQTLSTSSGTWSGSAPITFTYKWLRCSTSCLPIFGATSSSYKPGSPDVGRTIESLVTARNLYGSASATSLPTPPITNGGGTVQTGASKATCTTNPCQSGPAPSGHGQNGCTKGTFATNIVALGSINNGKTNECRLYGYYRPSNMSGAPAAVLVAPGNNGLCGGDDVAEVFKNSRWQKVADANRLVLILLAKPSSPSCRGGWYGPNITVPAMKPGSASDEPYLRTVVADAKTRLSLDSQRIYLTGVSAGGNLVYDAACDPVTSMQFRGFAAVSEFMQTKINGSSPVSGTEQCAAPGKAQTANASFFIMNIHGTQDGSVPFGGHCLPAESHCVASFAENARWWAKHMGCGATPSVSMFGTPSKLNEKDDYSTCLFGSPSVSYESVKVQNGCHAWQGLDASPASPSTCNGNPSTNNTERVLHRPDDLGLVLHPRLARLTKPVQSAVRPRATVRLLMRRRSLLVIVPLGATLLVAAVGIGSGRLAGLFESSDVYADSSKASATPVQVSITFGGQSRSYWFYRPASFRPGAPLLVVLPGDGYPTPGVPDYQLLADSQGIVLAFPLTQSQWRDPQDSPFVGAVIDDVVSKAGADPRRVYLMGGSAGGFAAYRMACGQLGGHLAGVGGLFAGS